MLDLMMAVMKAALAVPAASQSCTQAHGRLCCRAQSQVTSCSFWLGPWNLCSTCTSSMCTWMLVDFSAADCSRMLFGVKQSRWSFQLQIACCLVSCKASQ